MPRAKQKVYQYNSNGKFINEFESKTQVRSKYFSYDNGKRPIIRNNKYEILPDNTIISCERLGRDTVKNIWRIENNPFIKLGYNNDPIKVLNLNGVVIAKFASIKIASLMTKIPSSTIHSMVYNSKGSIVKNKNGLLFKLDGVKREPKK